MHAVLLVISPDADSENLSRLDPSLLSEQALFEMFVEGFENKSRFQDGHRNYTDFHGWPTIEKSDGEQYHFEASYDLWSTHGVLRGSLNLRFLPETVSILNLAGNEICGTICTEDLPRGMYSLFLQDNQFEGDFEIASLPDELTVLDIEKNNLRGTLDIASLPLKIEEFHASQNKFTGSVDLNHLPRDLTVLDLSKNFFSGEVNFITLRFQLESLNLSDNAGLFGPLYGAALPPGLKQLKLKNVRLSGNIRLEDFMQRSGEVSDMDFRAFDLPDSVGKLSMYYDSINFHRFPDELWHLDCSKGQIQGTTGLRGLPRGLIRFMAAENSISGSIETSGLPRRLGELVLSHNRFSGEINMQNLPDTLKIFDIANNLISGVLLFEHLPEGLALLDISKNADISGTARGQALPRALRYFATDGTRVVREDNVGKNTDFLGFIRHRLSHALRQ